MNYKLTFSIKDCMLLGSLLLALCACTTPTNSQKLEQLIADCSKRENNDHLRILRERVNQAPKSDVLASGVDQSLRLDCNAKLASEAPSSPAGHQNLVGAIVDSLYQNALSTSGGDKSKQMYEIKRAVDRSIKKHGLCSWMLMLAEREESLGYLLHITTAEAASYGASHFAYLQLYLRDNGYAPKRQLNR
jgi:hypothetical protein